MTGGCRLVLVYNLCRRGKGPAPEPPGYEREQSRVIRLLRAWAKADPAEDSVPTKLVYPLEHAYTEAELAFSTLKGADSAMASVLTPAASDAECELHLALISIEESGAAEYSGRSWRGRHWDDENDVFEAGEVFDRSATLSEWRRPDGQPAAFGPIPFEDEEISPPGALEDMQPDEEHFEEASGNEGASFERRYSRAALVLWPRDRALAVLNQAGLSATLPCLEDLVARWAAAKEESGSALWRQDCDLSRYTLATWPAPTWHSPEDESPTQVSRMLTMLTRLQDTERLDAFLADITGHARLHVGDASAICEALATFSASHAIAVLERLIAGTASNSPDACGRLLHAATTTLRPGELGALAAAGITLIDALPGDPAHLPPDQPWQRTTQARPRLVADMMVALARIDHSLAARATDYFLAWPKAYGLDTVLIPALRWLITRNEAPDSQSFRQLLSICNAHLQSRVAEPLEPPRDWHRSSSVPCECSHCTELSRFLADPVRSSGALKANEDVRRHVEEIIQQASSDVDQATERRGRPYSLICTKNEASYERRVEQRRQDLDDLGRFAT